MANQRPRPLDGSALSRFLFGLLAVYTGCRFMLRAPELRRLWLAPLLLSILLGTSLLFVFLSYSESIVVALWARPDFLPLRLFWYLFYLLVMLAGLVATYAGFFLLYGLLASPFNSAISERVERLKGGQPVATASWRAVLFDGVRALAHETFKLSIWLGVMLPLWLFSWAVPVVGAPLLSIGGGYLTARLLAYEYLDFAMERRGWSFRHKRRVLAENRAATVGFGTGLALSMLVPIVGFVALSAAAASGTLLFCELQIDPPVELEQPGRA